MTLNLDSFKKKKKKKKIYIYIYKKKINAMDMQLIIN